MKRVILTGCILVIILTTSPGFSQEMSIARNRGFASVTRNLSEAGTILDESFAISTLFNDSRMSAWSSSRFGDDEFSVRVVAGGNALFAIVKAPRQDLPVSILINRFALVPTERLSVEAVSMVENQISSGMGSYRWWTGNLQVTLGVCPNNIDFS